MTKQLPIIDLRHQIDWRRRLPSELCTLSLWAGAALLFSPLWTGSARPHAAAVAHFHVAPLSAQGGAIHAATAFTERLGMRIASGGIQQAVSARDGSVVASLYERHLAGPAGATFHASANAIPIATPLIDGGIVTFASAILVFAAFLWIWNRLSAGGRKPAQHLRVDYAHHFNLCAFSLHAARKTNICTVHHDDDGRIITISPNANSHGAPARHAPWLSPETLDDNPSVDTIAA